MKKNKFMVLGMSAIALALILAFAGCVTVPGERDTPSAAEAAAQLAADFNALKTGLATVNGATVTLTESIQIVWWDGDGGVGGSVVLDMDGNNLGVPRGTWFRGEEFTLIVPAGVTLDLTGVTIYNGGIDTLTVNGTVNARTGFFGDDRTMTINGNGTINLIGMGHLFYVGRDEWRGHTLTLDGVTLVGVADNNVSLVRVSEGGELVLLSGAITGNSVEGNRGGGVRVNDGGTFTMQGGTISGNSVSNSDHECDGGGIFVDTRAIFTMTGGEISGNSTSHGGGGVGVMGTFTMSGGTISGNTAYSEEEGSGGGVYLLGGTFIMEGGVISGNNAMFGGGVCIGGTFTMEGGTIYGSDAAEGLANTAGVEELAALAANLGQSPTIKWGTGGEYTKGGVPQIGGSDIEDMMSAETLIAIPASAP